MASKNGLAQGNQAKIVCAESSPSETNGVLTNSLTNLADLTVH
jgi:hypothetical protein